MLKHEQENSGFAMKLIEMKTLLLEYETRMRVYPAAEIRTKIKVLVHVLLSLFSRVRFDL